MLSDRRQHVLAALIEEYVSHALPVGSRTLVEHYKLGVSPATVRNELSVLEDAGYITQPHTSAGRVPTDVGYRSFVDDLLKNELESGDADEKASKAAQQLRESATEIDDLVEQITSSLAHFTECLSIVLPPSKMSLHIRQLSFISMTPSRVLIVIISEDGQVMNRNVEFAEDIACDDLAAAQNLLNRVVSGKSFTEMRDTMDAETLSALKGPLVSVLLNEVFACLNENESAQAHSLGLSTLMQQPEFANSQNLIPVMRLLENDTVLLEMLRDAEIQKGPIVRIGHENGNEQLSGVSMVAGQYGQGSAAGVVAIIGPTRMNYSQVIGAVRAAQQALDDV